MDNETENKTKHGPKAFVYGTLKKGHGNHRLLRSAEFLGRAYVEGPWKMTNLGAFPAVVSSETPSRIFGEVYLINTEILGALDLLEGYPHFYTRTKVQTPHGRAWMYHLNPASQRDFESLQVLDLGVWNPTVEERDWAMSLPALG